MKTDIHPLRRWLFDHQETLTAFGLRANMTPGHLSQIINGKRSPSLRTIEKITKATAGELRANDFQQLMPGLHDQ